LVGELINGYELVKLVDDVIRRLMFYYRAVFAAYKILQTRAEQLKLRGWFAAPICKEGLAGYSVKILTIRAL